MQTVDGRNLVNTFETWGQFLDQTDVEDKRSKYNESRVGSGYGYRFTSTRTFEEAQRLARDGWAEGEEAVKTISAKLFDVLASYVERENVVYDVEGTGIDVARFLDGEPECWQQFEVRRTQEAGRRLIRIVYNCSASAGIEAATIMVRGAAVVALVQLLEYAGHGVEVVVGEAVNYDGRHTETYVKVKSVEQPLDLARIAYAVAHPSMLRRHIFSICEQLPEPFYGMVKAGTYGMPAELEDKGDLYLGCMMWGDPNWRDGLSAQKWVVAELKRQGVHMSEEL